MDFLTAIRKERGREILTVWRFNKGFQRDLFALVRSVLFEKQKLVRVRMQFLSAIMARHVNQSRPDRFEKADILRSKSCGSC